jgi:DNA-binding Lrp family transcriptional regulator
METLDKFDLAILEELQAQGRLSNAELAQRVGLSAAPCWRRVKSLEEAGFITGYRAEINRQKLAWAYWPLCDWTPTATAATCCTRWRRRFAPSRRW